MKRLLLLLIPLVLVVGCSDPSDLEARNAQLEAENASLKEARQTSTPATTSTTPVATQAAVKQNVFTLQVGDCLNTELTKDSEGIEVSHVELVSCDGPHINEVYAIFQLPDSGWKGKDYVWEQGSIGCRARFEEFVGIEWGLSTLDGDVIYPLEESWKKTGDREVVCLVQEESGMKVGSLKGSRR